MLKDGQTEAEAPDGSPEAAAQGAEPASQEQPADSVYGTYTVLPVTTGNYSMDSTEAGTVPQNVSGRVTDGGKHAALVVAAVILIIGIIGWGGFFYWYSLPENRAQRLMRSAEEHISRDERQEAAADYRTVLEIMPDSIEAENGLYAVWSETVTDVMDLVDQGEYQQALEMVRLLPEIDPQRETMNHSALTVIYRQWASDLAGKDDTDGVERLLAGAAGDLSGAEIEDIRQSIADTLRYFSLQKELFSDSQKMIDLHSEGKTAELFGAAADYSAKADEYVDLGGTLPLLYTSEQSGTRIGFYRYFSDIQFVIGDIDDSGRPQGEVTTYYGEYFGREDQFLYSFVCEWKEGRPNGHCDYREYGYDALNEIDDVEISGDVIDGMWDRETQERFSDGETYYISYETGKVIVISENGPDANVVGYNDSETKMISFSDAAVSGILGVPYIYMT